MVFRNYLGCIFFSVGSPPVGNGDLVVFFWQNPGPGHLEQSRDRAENGKSQFTGARGAEMKKKLTTISEMVVRNLLTLLKFCPTGPTGAGNRKIRGVLGHFGLGRPLAFREIPGPGRNRKNANSRCKGSLNGEKKLPCYPGWSFATFLHFWFCLTGPSGTGNHEIREFQAILAQDGLWHLEKSRGWPKTGKYNFPVLEALLGGNPDAPKISPRKCATLLHFTFWLTGPPRAGNHEIRVC